MGPLGFERGRLGSSMLAVLPHSLAMLCTSPHTVRRTCRGQAGVQQQKLQAARSKSLIQSFLMVTVGVVALLGTARARAGDHGRGAHGEVVVMVEHTVDLGM